MFGKVVKKTVADQVIDQIKSLLAGGNLRPGNRLPPERQLAEMLGVSRPSLREALRALEYAGVLETRVGEGVFVADGNNVLANNLQVSHLIKQYALEEMIEVRKVIEAATVRLAIERGADEDFEALRKVHDDSKKMLHEKEHFVRADYAFHQALAEAGGNSIFVAMLQTMRQMMSEFNIEILSTIKGRKTVLRHHDEILNALNARNRNEAQRLLEMHLDNVVTSMKAKNGR